MGLRQLHKTSTALVVVLLLLGAGRATAQTSSFTYQGRLTDSGAAATGNYDLQFALWDSASGGTQIGSTQTINAVPVSNGVFTVSLDFGADSFPGANRFLEIGARPGGAGVLMILLTPRQPVTSIPYAIRSVNASSADNATTAATAINATQLGGAAASQYVQAGDSRLSDARSPTAGSTNYIQTNPSSAQSANFNISGNGTVGGTLSAAQFNVGVNRVLSVSGAGASSNGNTFAGVGAGVNTTPNGNAIDGNLNSFFGNLAGNKNTIGNGNSLFGNSAGSSNTTGSSNSFFGLFAGAANIDGSNNAFFGRVAGADNTNGGSNSFFGDSAGSGNTQGFANSFFGANAGFRNGTGRNNTILGASANFGSTDLSNATAIGALAQVDQSNSLVLGSIKNVNGATADTKVGIGVTAPTFKLHVIDSGHTGLRVEADTAGGTVASFGGFGEFQIDAVNVVGGRFLVRENGNVGIGTAVPSAKLEVEGDAWIVGKLNLFSLGSGGSTPLCLNSNPAQVSACSSSLRYKTNIAPFSGGLDIINHLRPISFEWKQNHAKDIGLGAEEVEKVEPLLTFRNDKGETEGVKYNQLSAVFINAFKEQQAQISHQQEQIERQQKLIREQQSSATQQKAEIEKLNSRLQTIERMLRKRSSSPK